MTAKPQKEYTEKIVPISIDMVPVDKLQFILETNFVTKQLM